MAVKYAQQATKYVSKWFTIYNTVKKVHFLLPPFILRLYTGCRLGQTLSKSIDSFLKKLKC